MASSNQIQVVLPGDTVPCFATSNSSESSDSSSKATVKLGPGLLQNPESNEQIIAIKCGFLRHNSGGSVEKWWIDGNQRRYVPSLNDSVIGTIISKHAEFYKVDIGSAHTATLPALAFEGATKRNKPNLQVGMLVYARISATSKDLDPELDCTNPTSGKGDGFGELKDGFMFKVSLGLARSLLSPNCPVLQVLAKSFAFELAVGLNGRVWINSSSIPITVGIVNVIKNSEFLNPNELERMVEKMKGNVKNRQD